MAQNVSFILVNLKQDGIGFLVHIYPFYSSGVNGRTAPLIAVVGIISVRGAYDTAIIVELPFDPQYAPIEYHLIATHPKAIRVHLVFYGQLQGVSRSEVVEESVPIQISQASGTIGICGKSAEIESVSAEPTRADGHDPAVESYLRDAQTIVPEGLCILVALDDCPAQVQI
jgi:hypothetical protein